MAEKFILGFDEHVWRVIGNVDDGDDHCRFEHVKPPELLEIIQRLQKTAETSVGVEPSEPN
jgi:uncharacterized protein YndB with AHSA1/START domain